jgi:hypothetical protein
MTEVTLPRRPLWQAALLGGLGPMLVAWFCAVAIRQYVIGMVHGASVAMLLTLGALSDIGKMLLAFAIAFFVVELILVVIVSIAERRRVQPPTFWLCAGVVATTPLVLYSVWPDASAVPTWQILFVYFFGIAAAWITRRLRYGAWL